MYLTTDSHLEYIDNSYYWIISKQPNYKIGKRFEQTIHKERFRNDRSACECVFNIISHQRNANRRFTEIQYIRTRMAKIKRTDNTKFQWERRALWTLTHGRWQCEMVPPLRKKLGNFLQRAYESSNILSTLPQIDILPKKKLREKSVML